MAKCGVDVDKAQHLKPAATAHLAGFYHLGRYLLQPQSRH